MGAAAFAQTEDPTRRGRWPLMAGAVRGHSHLLMDSNLSVMVVRVHK
jgi:hypothetical protein